MCRYSLDDLELIIALEKHSQVECELASTTLSSVLAQVKAVCAALCAALCVLPCVLIS